jgi:hypothetical protein
MVYRAVWRCNWWLCLTRFFLTGTWSLVMFAGLQERGPSVVAQAVYWADFAPIRECSTTTGSRFAYKMLPEQDDGGYYGTRAALWNYVGLVFGEVEDIVQTVSR